MSLETTYHFLSGLFRAIGLDPLWLIYLPFLPFLVLFGMMVWFLGGYPTYLRNKGASK